MRETAAPALQRPFSPREELALVQRELETVQNHFDMTDDSDLIDCCIHQLLALERRRSYLIRLVRSAI